MSTHKSRSKKSKSKRRKSYQEHYEFSMNSLLDAFDTSLDISPIVANKSMSKKSYQYEEKQTEIPDFTLTLSSETDDIPRIKEIQHDEIYENNTDAYDDKPPSLSPPTQNNIDPINTNNIHLQKQQSIDIDHKSDCNERKQSNINHINNINNTDNTHNESLPLVAQFPPQTMLPNTPQYSQTMQFAHPQQATHPHSHSQLIQQQLSQMSQSYDFAMHRNINNYQQQPFSQSNDFSRHSINAQLHAQQQLMQSDNMNNLSNINNSLNINNSQLQAQQLLMQSDNINNMNNLSNINNSQLHAHQQLMQSDNPNNLSNVNNSHNISHFPPQKLLFPSDSSSTINASNLLKSNNNNNTMHANDALSNANTKEKDEIEEIYEEEFEDEDDENLFMPITPTLSGSALRALLSQLRRKCKTLQFKSKQQRKYIINVRNEINSSQNEISNQKIQIYDHEQSIIMLQNQNDVSHLEYLRGAELHQTRQELVFIVNKMNELQADNLNLKQQMKLQELDHSTYNKSLKDEYQRLLREINQHKVLFDQRGREIKGLKESNDNQNEDFSEQMKQTNSSKEEMNNKLITVTQQLATLRKNYEDIKEKYDVVYQEKEKFSKLNKDFELELEEKEQNIISLTRVKNNLEQEIEALCRTNRNFREIRNKSTSQLLESQKYEIDSMKQQIGQQYEKYLEQEKIKNDKLAQLLKEKDMEINNMKNNGNNNNNYDYNETLEMLETENNELRKKLEENSDPYNYNEFNASTASSSMAMDEFGILMLKSAKEEIEQLRQTNEKLMKLHAKNHFKKPRMQDQETQTYDGTTNSPNSSFGSIFNQSTIGNEDNHQFEELSCSPSKSDKVLINDLSIVTTVDNSFTNS